MDMTTGFILWGLIFGAGIALRVIQRKKDLEYRRKIAECLDLLASAVATEAYGDSQK